MVGKPVDPQSMRPNTNSDLAVGEPFFPYDLQRTRSSRPAVLVVFALAISFGPKGPSGPPDPTLVAAEPRPDWYFLPLFALLALSPPEMETAIMLGMPVVLVAVLVLLPFVAGRRRAQPTSPANDCTVRVGIVCYLWRTGVAAASSPLVTGNDSLERYANSTPDG